MSNVVASVDGHKSHLDGFVVSLAIVAAIHDTKKISYGWRLSSFYRICAKFNKTIIHHLGY